MSSGTFVFWTKVSLWTVVTCFIAAVPDDYLAKSLRTPSSYEDYQPSNGLFDGALYSQESRTRRAPWAPSMTRSEAYLRKVMELTARKGKRGTKTLQEDPPLRNEINLLGYLDQERPRGSGDQRRSANQELSKINEFADPTVEVIFPGGFYGRRWEDSEPKNSDDKDVLVQFVGQNREPNVKRVPSDRLYIGLGQHAANAAINAFDDILSEGGGKNYKQERLPNPVKFLGRR